MDQTVPERRTRSAPVQAQALSSGRGLVLWVSSLGGFLVTFMTSSVNIALPLIEAEFHVSAVTLSWISLSYILTAAATLLPLGRLADLYGRMRFYILGMVIFTVICFASAFAPSAGVLLALRAFHGIGLAVGSVTAVALVILAFPPETRGRALGLNVIGVYLGLALGPVLGGLIIHNFGWRSLFLIVSAGGALNLAVAVWKLRRLEWREPRTAGFDFLGSAVFAVALAALLVGFSFLPEVAGAALIAVGVIGLAGFIYWEGRAADPLLRVDLLRGNRVFACANVASLINYAATAAMVFLLSLYLQYNRGLDPQTAGFVLVTGTFVQALLSPLVGRLTDRVEARWLSSAGMAITVLGLLALSFLAEDTSYAYLIASLVWLGIGFALFATPITHTVMGSVRQSDVGIASATLSTMRLSGQTISMGLATLVIALLVGRAEVQPSDYPGLLRSVRVSFLIFTVLCVFGVAASLVGPRRESR